MTTPTFNPTKRTMNLMPWSQRNLTSFYATHIDLHSPAIPRNIFAYSTKLDEDFEAGSFSFDGALVTEFDSPDNDAMIDGFDSSGFSSDNFEIADRLTQRFLSVTCLECVRLGINA